MLVVVSVSEQTAVSGAIMVTVTSAVALCIGSGKLLSSKSLVVVALT